MACWSPFFLQMGKLRGPEWNIACKVTREQWPPTTPLPKLSIRNAALPGLSSQPASAASEKKQAHLRTETQGQPAPGHWTLP